MRVLLISSSYLPVLGGLQITVHTLARMLLKSGHEVQVVTNRYPRTLPSQEQMDGLCVRRWHFLTPHLTDLKNRRLDLFCAGLFFYPATLARLAYFVHRFRPDVVNIHFPDQQTPFVLALRRWHNFRLVLSLHGDDIERWLASDAAERSDLCGTRLAELRTILRAADAVTACSNHLLREAIQLEPAVEPKGRVIYNGILLERFRNTSVHSHSRPYILAYGRLTRKKGFDQLLSAFAQVASVHPFIDLIIAGDGEERNNLATLQSQLSLTDRVFFYGRASPEEIVKLLNGCRFVVVPSRLEPFGIIALEAMAAGRPVLVTRVGGLTEFVDGIDNLFVEPTVEELAGGLHIWLIQNDSLKLIGARNRIRAEQYGWSEALAKYLSTYQSS